MEGLKKIVVTGPESTGKSTLCRQLAAYYGTGWCPEYAREHLTTHGPHYTFETLLTIAKGQVALESSIDNGQWRMDNGEWRRTMDNGQWTMDNGETVNRESSIVNGELIAADHQSAICNPQSTITPPQLETGNRKPETIFIDTDLYVLKVWSEYVFNKCHGYVLEEIAARKYDLYLFCNIDLPWEADPLREYPDEKPRKELYRIYKDILINQNVPWVEISGGYDERLQTAIAAVDKLLAG